MDTLILEFEAVADRGVALARHLGRPVFVPFAAPGDVAEVALTRRRDNFAEGRLVRLLTPSPHRVEPACPLFGRCGGCAWLHLAHPVEVAGKAASLKGFFSSRLDLAPEVFAAPVVSPHPLGYRNRLTLNVASERGRFFASLTEMRSNRPVEVAHCPVADARVNEALALLNRDAELLRLLGVGARIRLQADCEGGVRLTAGGPKPPNRKLLAALAELGGTPPFVGAYYQREGSGPLPADPSWPLAAPFSTRFGGRESRYDAPVGGFVQANSAVNELLCGLVEGLSERYEGLTAWDLYCGSGNFALGLAPRAKTVVGVEGERAAAAQALENCAAAGLSSVAVHAAPVEETLLASLPRAEFWLLDPPRTGAPEACAFAARGGGPRTIAYVSCAPATLLRDLGTLVKGGYRVESITALDMFPRTAHLEVLAVLTLTGSAQGA